MGLGEVLMASFLLITQGIQAGYGEDGFFASGISTRHRFHSYDDYRFAKPYIGGMPVQWRIDTKGEDMFAKYKDWTYPQTDLSPRVPLLDEIYATKPPCGLFRRWSHDEPIELTYSLPNDPTLATFIMGVVAADREMVISGNGFYLIDDDANPAPSPSVKGFMERKEPRFLSDRPTLGLR